MAVELYVIASLAAGASLASIMNCAPGPDRFGDEVEPVEVALEIGMADLDFEGAVAAPVGALEEIDEILVAEVEIEARGIGRYLVAPCSEQLVEREVLLLGCQVHTATCTASWNGR